MVTVTNDAPVITPIEDSTVLGSVQLSVTASDPKSLDLIYSWDTGDCPGAVIVDGDTATPTLSIAAGTSPPGPCQVSMKVCDVCGSGSRCTSAFGLVSLSDIASYPSSLMSLVDIFSWLFFVLLQQPVYSVFCILDIKTPPLAVCQPPMTLQSGADCTAHDVNIDAG